MAECGVTKCYCFQWSFWLGVENALVLNLHTKLQVCTGSSFYMSHALLMQLHTCVFHVMMQDTNLSQTILHLIYMPLNVE